MPQGKCHVALSAAVRRAALLCVFFAATFASGTILSPHASAQQPGGGGSPGGGSSPDGSAAGWVPQPRPGVTNPQSYADYDWTGLDGTVIRTPFVGSYPPEIYHDYGGSEGFSTSGSYFMEYPFNGTGSTGNTLAEVNTQFSGTTTYKWKWVPPNNAAGPPDTTNFPAPTLFTLYDMYATLGTRLWNPPYNAGLAASGTVSDGPPDSWTSSVSTVPQMITDVFPRRMVLPGSAPDSGGVSSVAMALSGNLDVTGKQSVVVGGYTGTGAMCISAATVNGQADPITLSAPNPLTNPLLGDGTNQYVYDMEQPDGYLAVPASVSVPGAGTADTAFLLPHVALPVTPAVPHTLPSTLTISGSSIVVSTAGHYPDPDTATSYPTASYIAKGLPTNNSDFGNHVVTLTVDGKASELANCQLFYTGSASNWPTSDGSIPDVQNFYIYYHPRYPLGAFTTEYDPSDYKPGGFAYTDFYSPYKIHIEKGTGGGALEVKLFDVSPTADTTLHRKLVRWIGTLRIQGIHRYVWIAAHERGHQNIFNMGGIYTPAVFDPAANKYVWPLGGASSDNDHVIDAWELQHHLRADGSASSSDTTGAYTGIGEPGDDEVLADVQALQPLMDNKDLWKLDWANFGVQYTGGSKLYWVAKPIATPAVFYWKFTPIATGNPASGSNITPFQTGGTTGPFGDGTYPIQTLKDLTDQYPSLLTGLPPQE